VAIYPIKIKPFVYRHLQSVTEYAIYRDISLQMSRIAAEQTAQFVIENMLRTPAFRDRMALFDYSLKAVDPKINGHYCEFGVFYGASINYI
jgi:hypothetical protein